MKRVDDLQIIILFKMGLNFVQEHTMPFHCPAEGPRPSKVVGLRARSLLIIFFRLKGLNIVSYA